MLTDRLRGSLPALVTPLRPDLRIHEGDLAALVARAVADGAVGVLVAGSTGEGALLEPADRVEVTRIAREALRRVAESGREGAGPLLLAGASGPTVAAVERDVAALAANGADAVLVLAPSTYPLDPEELTGFHLEIADQATVPTLAYHIPQITGSVLTPETVRRLAAHPRIVGMKDSSPDAKRRGAFVEAAGDPRRFAVMTGHAPSLRSALADGVTGSITAIANVRQRQVVALHAAVAAADELTATRLQSALGAASDALGTVGSSLPAALKAALQLDGTIAERWCRPPLGSVAAGRLDHVRTAMLR